MMSILAQTSTQATDAVTYSDLITTLLASLGVVVAIFIAALSWFHRQGKKDLSNLKSDMDRRFDEMDTKISDLKSDMNRKFADVDRKFADVDRKFADIDRKFADIDRQFEGVHARLDNMTDRMDRLYVIVGESQGLRSPPDEPVTQPETNKESIQAPPLTRPEPQPVGSVATA